MGSVMQKLTEQERRILHNSLGLLYAKKPYRQHFAAHDGTKTYAACCHLAEMGYMEPGEPGDGLMRFFYTTKEGAAAVGVSPEDYLAGMR